MSESEYDYEEEKDEVIEPIRFYSSQYEQEQKVSIKKTFSANFASLRNPKKQQYKQIDKLLKNSAYNYKKPTSLLKELKKSQQKHFLVFLINKHENISLSISQKCDISQCTQEFISKLTNEFNKYLDNCEMINDYNLYELMEATEYGEKLQFDFPYEYSTKINAIKAKYLLLEPKTDNFLFYQQPTKDEKTSMNIFEKFDEINTKSSFKQISNNYSHQNNRKQSLIEYYSSGISQFINNEKRTQSNDTSLTNMSQQEYKEFLSQKAKLINPSKDQPTREISSCNFFSIFKIFKTKKSNSK